MAAARRRLRAEKSEFMRRILRGGRKLGKGGLITFGHGFNIRRMRVIGGKSGGRFLKVPKGLEVRPTPDLVKQAVFNSLGERVIAARVLELFGGSGALSLESLSRGAASAVCVELSSKHARHIRDNMKATGVEPGRFQVIVDDALKVVNHLAEQGRQFDLIFADPPYGEKNVGRRSESFAQKLLDHPKLPLLLAPGGLFVLGHTKRDTLDFPSGLEEIKMLKHGDSVMRFLQRKP
jgi:16S rRNA (guanine966-N2)-methyltransferase